MPPTITPAGSNADASGAPLTYFRYTRDPEGLPTRCLRENGHVIHYAYNTADRLTRELWTTTGASPAQRVGWVEARRNSPLRARNIHECSLPRWWVSRTQPTLPAACAAHASRSAYFATY